MLPPTPLELVPTAPPAIAPFLQQIVDGAELALTLGVRQVNQVRHCVGTAQSKWCRAVRPCTPSNRPCPAVPTPIPFQGCSQRPYPSQQPFMPYAN